MEAHDESSDNGSEDEDSLEPVTEAPRKRAVTQRRQVDNANFAVWLQSNREKLFVSSKAEIDDKSVNALIRENENRRIISSPRDYQVELFERAKERNTIAVLDTGSGKTLIAALLLRHVIETELLDRAAGHHKRIAFFLVDKVALVFQQHAVLACNLDHPLQRLCGDMVEELWSSKEFWDKQFSQHMAIICTADILLRCLTHSYISMKDINILIFDEAHHAKKNHAYARIAKDFLLRVPPTEQRPRILGMTASPVDGHADVDDAICELESLLDSQIATWDSEEAEKMHRAKAMSEQVVEYDSLPSNFETDLCRALEPLLGYDFKKNFDFCKTAAAELGIWCADRVWHVYTTMGGLARMEARMEKGVLRPWLFAEPDDYDTRNERLAEARKRIADTVSKPLEPREPYLSSKVISLVDILRSYYSAKPDTRCIIFVKMRLTAMVLAAALADSALELNHLRVGILAGGGTDHKEASMTLREQIVAISKFRKGETNCLVATSVAEEGLDIPACNLVVRFDLFDSTIQYIQSRGRARHESSNYLVMLEKDNQAQRLSFQMHIANAFKLRTACASLPASRKLEGLSFDADYFLSKEKHAPTYVEAATGAILNYRSSMSIVADFAGTLEWNNDTAPRAVYHVSPAGKGFICELIMPQTSPIGCQVGREQTTKQGARCSAAYEMCLVLRRKKYLNEYLRPVYAAKKVPAMRNARLAINSKKRAEYGMRMKPEIWKSSGTPGKLFATYLALSDYEAVQRPCQPLVLLTREALPSMKPIPLFFGQGRTAKALPRACNIGLDVSEEQLVALKDFTLRVFIDVFSKEYDAGVADLPYFLAPLTDSSSVDWTSVVKVQREPSLDWQSKPDDFFLGKYLTDPFEGSRKLWVQRVCHELKQTDLEPAEAPKPKIRKWALSTKTIENYSLNAWGKLLDTFQFIPDQPVLEATLVSLRRNLLDEFDQEHEAQRCWVIPQPLNISAVSCHCET